MTNREIELMNRFAEAYAVDCKHTGSNVSNWDFTYEWNDRKFYVEMKSRNFGLDYAMQKYPEGLILEMHKYERILRRTKNEKGSQGLYLNFFNDGQVLAHNLNKIKLTNWHWKTLPETTDFSKKRFVYKYITFVDYSKGKILYI
jgi:hypothetical protein